jgi:hypothetical protein
MSLKGEYLFGSVITGHIETHKTPERSSFRASWHTDRNLLFVIAGHRHVHLYVPFWLTKEGRKAERKRKDHLACRRVISERLNNEEIEWNDAEAIKEQLLV